jgi:hypothetical protein
VVVVCSSAIVGNVLFGFRPLFALLALLVSYQTLGGWRSALRRGRGPGLVDGALTLAGCAGALLLIALIDTRGPLVVSVLGAMGMLLTWDTVRCLFPSHWHARLWRYEHSYKMTAGLFGMLSAASGNVLASWQPWSQLLPSAAGVIVIGAMWARMVRAPVPAG